jgi:hypothetical protein
MRSLAEVIDNPGPRRLLKSKGVDAAVSSDIEPVTGRQ